MSSVTPQQVEEKIKEYIDPYLEQDLVAAKAVKNVKVDGDKVTVDVVLGYPSDGFKAELASKLQERVESLEGVSSASFNVSHKIDSHSVQKRRQYDLRREEHYCDCVW